MKDRIEKGEFKVAYCPNEQMVADFFSKPLQGSLFKRLSAVIMDEIDLLTFLKHEEAPSPSKKRVGVTACTQNNDAADVENKYTYADVLKRTCTKK